MTDLKNKKITLVGYGASNRAMCDFLMAQGIFPTIRNRERTKTPHGCTLICENYLEVCEDIAVRSPVIRPDRISAGAQVFCEAGYALDLARAHKIGISGSDGKTTTSTLIYNMLCQGGYGAYLCGNIGTPVITYAPSARENEYLVCELSSFQLIDMSPRLDVAVLTNITQNHLDWHTDMNEYIEAKKRLICGARHAVLCYDDPILRTLDAKNSVLTYFTLENMPRATGAEHIVYVRDGYIWHDSHKIVPLDKIALKGKFNILNIEASIGALATLVDTEAICSVVRGFSGVDSRMKFIRTVGGVSFIDSSIDSTPSRTLATVSAFDKAKCVLILGGYDKNLSYECLRALEGIRGAVIFGANAQKIHSAIADICRCERASTLDEATRVAYALARDGDFVILSPASASFDMFKDYKERSKKFNLAVRGIK